MEIELTVEELQEIADQEKKEAEIAQDILDAKKLTPTSSRCLPCALPLAYGVEVERP